MVLVFLFYFALGNYILSRSQCGFFPQGRRIFNCTYIIFLIYLVWTHLSIGNPAVFYLGNSDECWIYEHTQDLSKYNLRQLPVEAFDFEYIELPLSMLLFAVLAKLSFLLGIGDFCIFIKAFHIFLGALIPALMYLTYQRLNPSKVKGALFVMFAVFSPIMFNACQLARDIHVVFLYTLMLYVVFQETKSKYIWLVILGLINVFVRYETGLFSFLILFFPLVNHYKQYPVWVRALVIFIVSALCIAAIPYILDVTSYTLTAYRVSGLEDADSGSLGVKMASLPFPLNLIGTFTFGQIQPFPCWMAFAKSNAHSMELPLSLLCVIPVYWLPIITLTYFMIVRRWKHIDNRIKTLALFAIVFLFMVSYGQQLPRRLMSVYPFVFISYIWLQNKFNVKRSTKLFQVTSILGYVLLHFVYLAIK